MGVNAAVTYLSPLTSFPNVVSPLLPRSKIPRPKPWRPDEMAPRASFGTPAQGAHQHKGIFHPLQYNTLWRLINSRITCRQAKAITLHLTKRHLLSVWLICNQRGNGTVPWPCNSQREKCKQPAEPHDSPCDACEKYEEPEEKSFPPVILFHLRQAGTDSPFKKSHTSWISSW